jgi:hypothetical protein
MRFQKRIQILPWVHLNISATGFSFSFGPPGLSVNIGKKGLRVTAGIPGTGISTSHLLASEERASDSAASNIEAHHPGINFSLLPPAPEDDDPLYRDAVSFAVFSRVVSISAVQRKILVGWSRATALVARMEADGIITPPDSQGSREVIWFGLSPLMPVSTKPKVEPLSREQRFAEWLENYLEPSVVNITPMYARAVLATLTHSRLSAQFLIEYLKVNSEMAESMIVLMERDGIFPSEGDPTIPVSRMDIAVLTRSFEQFERQS